MRLPLLIPGLALVSLVAVGNSLAGKAQTKGPPRKLVHNWKSIQFAWTLPGDKGRPIFIIGHDPKGEGSQGLRLDILNITQEFRFFETNAITARLYRANGEIVEPTADGKRSLKDPVSIRTVSSTVEPDPSQVMTWFPWGPNTLEESWIEVSISPERYWLEIPYGFDRDPTEPLAPSLPAGAPKFVPAMKSLTEHDHVVRWQNVKYDLGKTRNGCWLTLLQSNPFDAESQVEIAGDLGVRQNVYSPRPAVRIVGAGGAVNNGTCVNPQEILRLCRRTPEV